VNELLLAAAAGRTGACGLLVLEVAEAVPGGGHVGISRET
jgi:hypothetical protein